MYVYVTQLLTRRGMNPASHVSRPAADRVIHLDLPRFLREQAEPVLAIGGDLFR